MAKTFKIVTLALVTALTLTACGSNGGDEGAKDTANNAAPTVNLEPEVQEKKEQADVAPGEAIVPGSIESDEATGLSSECEAAIKPARDLAAKYPSGLLVPAEDQTINTVLTDARTKCSDEDFGAWYYDEFVGWQNAKP